MARGEACLKFAYGSGAVLSRCRGEPLGSVQLQEERVRLVMQETWSKSQEEAREKTLCGVCGRLYGDDERADDGYHYTIFCDEIKEGESERMKEYDYNVEFVGNYWVLTTKISVELEDTVGNMSEEAREKAEEQASEAIAGEIGVNPLNFVHSCLVTLILDGEEYQI